MVKNLIFFHGGGGEEDYEADAKLVASLKSKLGSGYSVHYPLLPDNGTPDLGRRKQISHEISASEENVILVGHSLGASVLLACLSEIKIRKKIAGIFLLATPFGMVMKIGLKPSSCSPILQKKLIRIHLCFFIIAVMMKKYHSVS